MQMETLSKGNVAALEARKWLGTPFMWGQRTPGVGVDCANLVKASLEAAGTIIPREAIAAPESDKYEEILALLRDACDEVELPMIPGDVVLIRIPKVRQHLAICSREGFVIHANGAGAREEELDPRFLVYEHHVFRQKG